MATKTLTITDDAYSRLKSIKFPEESFSEVIKRITSNKPISDFYGILTKEEADLLEKNMKENRKIHGNLSAKRIKNLRRRRNNGDF